MLLGLLQRKSPKPQINWKWIQYLPQTPKPIPFLQLVDLNDNRNNQNPRLKVYSNHPFSPKSLDITEINYWAMKSSFWVTSTDPSKSEIPIQTCINQGSGTNRSVGNKTANFLVNEIEKMTGVTGFLFFYSNPCCSWPWKSCSKNKWRLGSFLLWNG